MSYSMDMSNEKRPNMKKLLEEGWRKFKIISAEVQTSKKGNEMFVVNITDKKTGYNENIYLVNVEGKRWLLKELLSACGIEKDEQGKYNWDIPDIVNKEVAGFVEHENQKYTNRDAEEVNTTVHRITKFDILSNQVAWDE